MSFCLCAILHVCGAPYLLSPVVECICIYACLWLFTVLMGSPLPPRESGKYIAERSQDVSVEEGGVQRVAEMLYNLRHGDSLTASFWKKANPLAPTHSSDQASD